MGVWGGLVGFNFQCSWCLVVVFVQIVGEDVDYDQVDCQDCL